MTGDWPARRRTPSGASPAQRADRVGASRGRNGIVNLHGRADLYPEPEQFRPERFLSREYGPFEYLPFGGGSRRCLGAAFAVYEMKLVLATVLRSHNLRLIRDVPVRAALRNTTVGPASTIEMARG